MAKVAKTKMLTKPASLPTKKKKVRRQYLPQGTKWKVKEIIEQDYNKFATVTQKQAAEEISARIGKTVTVSHARTIAKEIGVPFGKGDRTAKAHNNASGTIMDVLHRLAKQQAELEKKIDAIARFFLPNGSK